MVTKTAKLYAMLTLPSGETAHRIVPDPHTRQKHSIVHIKRVMHYVEVVTKMWPLSGARSKT